MTASIHIRPMKKEDLGQVIEVQRQTFSLDLCEDREVFENRFEIYGQYFLVAILNDLIVGYQICFPWKLGETPVNNEKFPALLPKSNCFYLHDITLLPLARGNGVAQVMINQAKMMTQQLGYDDLSLVSVEQSGSYWDKLGFAPIEGLADEKVDFLKRVYGSKSRLMKIKVEN